MTQFGLRYLYKHLGKAIKQIPFEITNHNKVIAVVFEKPDGRLIRELSSGVLEVFDPSTNSWEPYER